MPVGLNSINVSIQPVGYNSERKSIEPATHRVFPTDEVEHARAACSGFHEISELSDGFSRRVWRPRDKICVTEWCAPPTAVRILEQFFRSSLSGNENLTKNIGSGSRKIKIAVSVFRFRLSKLPDGFHNRYSCDGFVFWTFTVWNETDQCIQTFIWLTFGDFFQLEIKHNFVALALNKSRTLFGQVQMGWWIRDGYEGDDVTTFLSWTNIQGIPDLFVKPNNF